MEGRSTPPMARIAPTSSRYQIVERLGEGAMAVVFRAVDNEERRWVAMKVLMPEHRANSGIRARFAAEAEAMARLRHRNLVQVFDVQVDDPAPFFTMELATGGSLVDWVKQNGPMPPRMATDLAIQLCKALRAAHSKGIVHRDVKPHNVLVTRRGVAKLTDFGIARHEDLDEGLTMDGAGMGTLGYIAPEQKGGASEVDGRADIYSTGATLHTLLTGRTMMDLYLADQHPEMLDGVPEPLHEPLLKATRYRPADRYQTIQDLAKALFHAKAALPEDPEDTPPLVTRDPTELTDQLDRFVSQPSQADLTDPTFTADNEATSSTPSIARDSLLRPDHEVEQPPFTSRVNLTNLALGSTPLVALIFLLTILLGLKSSVLGRTVERIELTDSRLEQVVDAEAPLVDELVEIGADGERLRKLYAQADQAEGAARLKAAETLAIFATQEITAAQPPPGSSGFRIAKEAEQRVKRLEGGVEDAKLAREWDRKERSDAMGGLSTALRLAPATPP